MEYRMYSVWDGYYKTTMVCRQTNLLPLQVDKYQNVSAEHVEK